jgi:hypothetical protein
MNHQTRSESASADQVASLQREVAALRERLRLVEIEVAVIKANYATQENLVKLGAKR